MVSNSSTIKSTDPLTTSTPLTSNEVGLKVKDNPTASNNNNFNSSESESEIDYVPEFSSFNISQYPATNDYNPQNDSIGDYTNSNYCQSNSSTLENDDSNIDQLQQLVSSIDLNSSPTKNPSVNATPSPSTNQRNASTMTIYEKDNQRITSHASAIGVYNQSIDSPCQTPTIRFPKQRIASNVSIQGLFDKTTDSETQRTPPALNLPKQRKNVDDRDRVVSNVSTKALYNDSPNQRITSNASVKAMYNNSISFNDTDTDVLSVLHEEDVQTMSKPQQEPNANERTTSSQQQIQPQSKQPTTNSLNQSSDYTLSIIPQESIDQSSTIHVSQLKINEKETIASKAHDNSVNSCVEIHQQQKLGDLFVENEVSCNVDADANADPDPDVVLTRYKNYDVETDTVNDLKKTVDDNSVAICNDTVNDQVAEGDISGKEDAQTNEEDNILDNLVIDKTQESELTATVQGDDNDRDVSENNFNTSFSVEKGGSLGIPNDISEENDFQNKDLSGILQNDLSGKDSIVDDENVSGSRDLINEKFLDSKDGQVVSDTNDEGIASHITGVTDDANDTDEEVSKEAEEASNIKDGSGCKQEEGSHTKNTIKDNEENHVISDRKEGDFGKQEESPSVDEHGLSVCCQSPSSDSESDFSKQVVPEISTSNNGFNTSSILDSLDPTEDELSQLNFTQDDLGMIDPYQLHSLSEIPEVTEISHSAMNNSTKDVSEVDLLKDSKSLISIGSELSQEPDVSHDDLPAVKVNNPYQEDIEVSDKTTNDSIMTKESRNSPISDVSLNTEPDLSQQHDNSSILNSLHEDRHISFLPTRPAIATVSRQSSSGDSSSSNGPIPLSANEVSEDDHTIESSSNSNSRLFNTDISLTTTQSPSTTPKLSSKILRTKDATKCTTPSRIPLRMTPTKLKLKNKEKRLSLVENIKKKLINESGYSSDENSSENDEYIDTTISVPTLITTTNKSIVVDGAKHKKNNFSIHEMNEIFSNMDLNELTTDNHQQSRIPSGFHSSKSSKNEMERLTKELTDAKIQIKLQNDLLKDKFGKDYKDDISTLIEQQFQQQQLKSSEEIKELKSHIDELLSSFNELDDQLGDLAKENNNCKKIVNEILQLITEGGMFNNDLEMLTKLAQGLENPVLKNKLSLLGYIVEMILRVHLTSKDDTNVKLSELTNGLTSLLGKFKEQQSRLNSVDHMIDLELEKTQGLKAQVEMKDKQIADLKIKVDELKKQIDHLGVANPEEINNLNKQIDELTDTINQLHKLVGDKGELIKSLKIDKDALAHDLFELTGLSKNLKNENIRLTYENNNLENNIDGLENQLRSQSAKFNELFDSSAAINEDLQDLQLAYDDLITTDINFQTHLIKILSSILDKKSVKEAAEKILQLANRKKLGLDFASIKKVHSSVYQYDLAAIETIINDHAQLVEELNRLQKEVHQLHQQIAQLQQHNLQQQQRQLDDVDDNVKESITSEHNESFDSNTSGGSGNGNGPASPRSKLRLEEVVRRWKAAEEALAFERKQSKKRLDDLEGQNVRLKAQLTVVSQRNARAQ